MAKKNASANGHVSHEDFIRAWQEAASVKDVADKTGIEPRKACVRAGQLRKKGVPLKKFGRQTHADWDALKELAEGLA